MAETRPPTLPQFSRRLAVETPEHVVLEFELAGIGSRAAAAAYDALLVFALILLVSLAVSLVDLLPALSGAWAMSLLVLIWFGIIWGYFLLFEAFRGGRTPGKRRVGLRVVMDSGHPISIRAAAVRNLIRLVDIQPAGASLVGLAFVFFQQHNRRLGDLVAGTIVVRDQPEEITALPPLHPQPAEPDVRPPLLTDMEFDLLGRVLGRIDTMQLEIRRRFVGQLQRQFRDRLLTGGTHPELALAELYASELARRQSPAASRRAAAGACRPSLAHRFVALRREKWESLRRHAAGLQQRGLKNASGTEVIGFAAEYREIAADLARARTYGVDTRVLDHLERVATAGHHVLYGVRKQHTTRWHELVLRHFPAAVIVARGYVLAAALLFTIPGIVGYSLLRERPELATEIMPAQMLARAESGQRQLAEGIGYAETPSPYLPLVATSIIANNVQVAIAAFAFGITAGVGTVLVLAFNGLFFGSVLGMFANYGLADWLLIFVAGHGVLELTAIFIAGGAGLVVARAVIAPGDMARKDALIVQSRLAARLVGAAATLLLLAGVIEGFLSASDAPVAAKLGVSGASVAFLALYFESGRRNNTLFGPGMQHPTSEQGSGSRRLV
ncbi:MAG: stage II sporulation protein M [Gemmatimonadota bacterium]|nr:MAG: stage II sporulation protein M [Gemmatimonadota bacterium]